MTETEHYSVSKLDESTWLVHDKTKNPPTPHYYKTEKAVDRKIDKILKKVG